LSAELHERLEQLRSSRQRLVAAQDDERRRLERNLHDGAQQQLVGLRIKLTIARSLARREEASETETVLSQLAVEAEEAVQTLRDLAHGIYPPLLAAEGLPAALRAQAAKAVLPVVIEASNVGRYSEDVEATVYFCCLEALQNIVKYAGASSVCIDVSHDDGDLRFAIADDGAGFDEQATPRGAGMQNMADRVDSVEGTLTVSSSLGRGTTVKGRIPIPISAPDAGGQGEGDERRHKVHSVVKTSVLPGLPSAV
jgi:signal transduction histidine kinase